MRAYILDGFAAAGFTLTPLIDSPEVSVVKSIKSPAEIELVRAVNTLTVEGIRSIQRCGSRPYQTPKHPVLMFLFGPRRLFRTYGARAIPNT